MSDLRRLIESMDRINEATLPNKPLDNQLFGGGGGGGAGGGYMSPGYAAGRSATNPSVWRSNRTGETMPAPRGEKTWVSPAKPTPLPQGVAPSTAGAGRGTVNPEIAKPGLGPMGQVKPGLVRPGARVDPQMTTPSAGKDAVGQTRPGGVRDPMGRIEPGTGQRQPKNPPDYGKDSKGLKKSVAGHAALAAALAAGSLTDKDKDVDTPPAGGSTSGAPATSIQPVEIYRDVPQAATAPATTNTTPDIPKPDIVTSVEPRPITSNTSPTTATVAPVPQVTPAPVPQVAPAPQPRPQQVSPQPSSGNGIPAPLPGLGGGRMGGSGTADGTTSGDGTGGQDKSFDYYWRRRQGMQETRIDRALKEYTLFVSTLDKKGRR